MLKQMNKQRCDSLIAHIFPVVLLWTTGLLFGRWIASGLSGYAIGFARSAVMGQGYLLLLVFRTAVPSLLVLLFDMWNKREYIFFLVFLKALFFGFSVFLTVCAFQSAGWLVTILVFIADGLGSCLFVFSVLHLCCFHNKASRKFSFILMTFCVLIAVFDCFVLSPFVFSLFQ